MKNIKEFLKSQDYYVIDERYGQLSASNDTVIFLFVEPHSGTDNKYMMRVTTVTGFDRWSNSSAIEMFFDTEIEIIDYLKNHLSDIYMTLLKYLSQEYEDKIY